MAEKNPYYAIGRGYEQLRAIDQPKVKRELMSFFEQNVPQAFGKLRRGERLMLAHEYDAVGLIFAKYGVTDPWGFATTPESDETQDN